jgi:hypothetical protein
VSISHVKRVYNRLTRVLVVNLHGTVDIKLAFNEVLIEEGGDILPLRRDDSWVYQLNEDFVLIRLLDFCFCCQHLTVISE